jgi:hypothetical protein
MLARRAACATLAFGWLWLVAFGVFQGLSHTQAPWHTYFTVAGVGLLAGGVLDGAWSAWKGELQGWLRRPAARMAGRVCLAGAVAGVLMYQVAVLRESALVTRYAAWHITGELSRMYLASIDSCVQMAPPGAQLVLDGFPYGLDDSKDEYVLVQAGAFAPYSLGAAVRLAERRSDLRIMETGNGLVFATLPRGMQTTCSNLGGVWRVHTAYEL